MHCNKFEVCENTYLEGEWILVNDVWNQYQGDCVFDKASCPEPVGDIPSPGHGLGLINMNILIKVK